MKKRLAFALVAAAAACAPAEPVALTADQESRFAAATRGRTAGPPVDCVNMRNLGSNQSIGEALVMFRSTGGGTIYVNRPPAGCPDLRGRTLVIRTPATRLCRGDIATVLDPVSRTSYGSCALGAFTPYTR